MTARSMMLCSVLCVLVGATVGCERWRFGRPSHEGPRSPEPRELRAPVEVPQVAGIDVSGHTQVDLAERVGEKRYLYQRALKRLRQYFFKEGNETKRGWAEKEIEDCRLIKTYPYLVAEAIPGPDLRPTDIIPAADELYKDGVSFHKRGRRLIPFTNDKRTLKLAVQKFKAMISRYPSSDKIDEAAFHIAEIYKEYFNDNHRALAWYQRVWEWNPATDKKARFQAAVITDLRLHDRKRAVALYREVLKHEKQHKTNIHFAIRRIDHWTSVAASANEPLADTPPAVGQGTGYLSAQAMSAAAETKDEQYERQEDEDIQLSGETDVELVAAIDHERQEYAAALVKLANWYHQKGLHFKRTWAKRELRDLEKVQTYEYLIVEAAPPDEQTPTETSTSADELFQTAMRHYEAGNAGIVDLGKIGEARKKFMQLVRQFPKSDKIDDAAFYLGEIYDTHLEDYNRALEWYRKAREWDPRGQYPARFNAAVIYHQKLNDPAKALELYRSALEHEDLSPPTARWAKNCIKELEAPAAEEEEEMSEPMEESEPEEEAAEPEPELKPEPEEESE